jgi:hypothetical protein
MMIFTVGSPRGEVAQLQEQTFLQVAGGDACRIEPWTASARSTSSSGHGPIAASSSNEATRYPSSLRFPMIADPPPSLSRNRESVGLHRELPHQVVGQSNCSDESVFLRLGGSS